MAANPHCKLCNGKSFPDISSLRKHQWAAHRNIYKNLIEQTKKRNKWTKVQRQKYVATLKARKEKAAPLTVEGLLEKLKTQRNFMNDIVSLIEGMMKS